MVCGRKGSEGRLAEQSHRLQVAGGKCFMFTSFSNGKHHGCLKIIGDQLPVSSILRPSSCIEDQLLFLLLSLSFHNHTIERNRLFTVAGNLQRCIAV